jgi:hypothetical protein
VKTGGQGQHVITEEKYYVDTMGEDRWLKTAQNYRKKKIPYAVRDILETEFEALKLPCKFGFK